MSRQAEIVGERPNRYISSAIIESPISPHNGDLLETFSTTAFAMTMTHPQMPAPSGPIRTLVFDLGGVLTRDVWESTYFDSSRGIAARYGLDPEELRRCGQQLWKRYAYRRPAGSTTVAELESAYWQDFNVALGTSIPARTLVDLSRSFMDWIPGMEELLGDLSTGPLTLAVCTGTTPFWFEEQRHRLGLNRFVADEAFITSYDVGASKASPGFEMLKEVVRKAACVPARSMFIDDRQENIVRASEFGFSPFLFPSHSPEGASLLRAHVRALLPG